MRSNDDVGFRVDVLDGAAVFLFRDDAAPAVGTVGDGAGIYGRGREDRAVVSSVKWRVNERTSKSWSTGSPSSRRSSTSPSDW